MIWVTFLGGNGNDYGAHIVLDGNNIYVIGSSSDTWICSPTNCTVRSYTGGNDAYIAKLDSSGNLIWNTFLGGSSDDRGFGIVVKNGTIYATGTSNAAWACSPSSCTNRAYSSGTDTFVAKLDLSGNLTWNTFLGGNGKDNGINIVADQNGNTYVVGDSNAAWGCSPIACTVRAFVGGTSAGNDAFVAQIDSSGTLTWNTFLGGNDDDWSNGIAIDGGGNIYLTGNGLATWGSPVRAYTSGVDAFVAKMDLFGNLVWNTFLGGNGWDETLSIVVDKSGNSYVTGDSDAAWDCLPTTCTIRAYVGGGSFGEDAFATQIDSSGNLTWNTFLGGNGDDQGGGITLDKSGSVYVTGGSTATWGNPVRAYAGGIKNAFIAKIVFPSYTLFLPLILR